MINPLVSIIIPTKNAERDLDICMESIKEQTYKNVEIVVVDGFSKDNTLGIAKKRGARIIMNHKIFAEPGISLGMEKARGNLLMVIAVDNIFKSKNAIEKIVNIFEQKDIYAVFPKHSSEKTDTIFTKYINAFTDPFNHFVYGYASNAATFNKVFKVITHNNIFDVYNYKSGNSRPIIALAQGFTVRESFVKTRANEMDDIEPILKLIDENKKIAFAHSIELYHHTVKNFSHFVRKQTWTVNNVLNHKSYGINSRVKTLSASQKIKAYIFPIYSISFFVPLARALFYFLKDKQKEWLFHPIITFITGFIIIKQISLFKLGYGKDGER